MIIDIRFYHEINSCLCFLCCFCIRSKYSRRKRNNNSIKRDSYSTRRYNCSRSNIDISHSRFEHDLEGEGRHIEDHDIEGSNLSGDKNHCTVIRNSLLINDRGCGRGRGESIEMIGSNDSACLKVGNNKRLGHMLEGASELIESSKLEKNSHKEIEPFLIGQNSTHYTTVDYSIETQEITSSESSEHLSSHEDVTNNKILDEENHKVWI